MGDETDVIDSDPQAEQALLQMAQDYDTKGQYEMPDEGQPTQAETPEPTEKPPETPEPKPTEPELDLKPAAEEKTRDEKGRFLPKPGEKAPEVGAEAKPESPYTKAQKEQARIQKTWKQTEEEKAAVRAEAARLQQERQQFERQRQEEFVRNMPRAQKDGFTAPDYLKVAEDFAKEGDFESAFKAQATANQLVAYEQQYYTQKAQETQQQLVMAQFTDDLQKVIQKDPQAAWETQSPLALEMNDLLNKYPKAIYFEGAAQLMYGYAKRGVENQRLAAAEARVAELEAQAAQRDRNSQPLRGGPTKPGQPARLEDMSDEEGEAHMLRMAERMDAGYGHDREPKTEANREKASAETGENFS